MNKRGMTIFELIIVIVIMGIIATFTVISVSRYYTKSRIMSDTNSVVTLNKVTYDYMMINGLSSNSVFSESSTDEERLLLLVDSGFLDRVIIPLQDGASFVWNEESALWELEGGETIGFTGNSLSFDFSTDLIDQLIEDGVVFRDETRWNDENGYLENVSGEQRMFIPVGKSSYSVTVSAALSEGTNGGYGIFFDTILPDGDENKDTGWILQFDRGFDKGSIIIRPRVNGSEQGVVWTLKGRSSDLIPSIDQDASWWTKTHSVKIVVSKNDGDSKTATFYIDGVNIGSYDYTFVDSGDIIYSGFRTWHTPTTKFYSISVN